MGGTLLIMLRECEMSKADVVIRFLGGVRN